MKIYRYFCLHIKGICWTFRIYTIYFLRYTHSRYMEMFVYKHQGRSESTLSVAFEVLIIKSEIDFINLFIFKCLTSNVNLFIFNCLKSNTNYLRDTNKFLRSRTLCTNILKCKFPTKGIELTRFEFFEGPRRSQLWGTWFRPFR